MAARPGGLAGALLLCLAALMLPGGARASEGAAGGSETAGGGGERFKIEGRAVVPGVKPQDWVAGARVLVDGEEHVGFLKTDGSFVVHDIPSGSYVVEVISPAYKFEPVRVDITSKGKMRARYVNYIKTSEVVRLPYPLQMKSSGPPSYFIKRESWGWTDFLMNPMVCTEAYIVYDCLFKYPRDCHEIFKQSEENSEDGIYVIQPAKEPIGVYCNMQDGGWTVIQHITANSTVDFDRIWQDYKHGFGSLIDNYWLGNEYMHQLTSSPIPYILRVKLVDLNAEIKWGQYEPFRIEGEASQYRIRLGLYKGNAADALSQDTEAYLHDNQKFTTKDQDNDNYFQNCAKLEYNGIPGGGWWYDACAGANLNRRNVIYWQKDCNKEHQCNHFGLTGTDDTIHEAVSKAFN
ncbi:hypothetical protein lerEdw1_017241 [Lerista edwardsae]|nr:hypothetical protein lerEdw1_017241 [Lerista edwardsae]